MAYRIAKDGNWMANIAVNDARPEVYPPRRPSLHQYLVGPGWLWRIV